MVKEMEDKKYLNLTF